MAVVTLPIPEHAAFTRDDEQSIQKNIHQARTILRTVALAAEAQDDGAVLYGDNGAGYDNDFTQRNTTFMAWNLMHLARLIKDAGGIPAHGNQKSLWDKGERFDHPNPEYR